MFSGSISSLCKLPNPSRLYKLDLSDNRFLGKLPTCWRQFRNLQVLNLASNNFTGHLPTSSGYLPEIAILHLRNNDLTGEIPSLGNCKHLALLDLWENRITGNVTERLLLQMGCNLIFLRFCANELCGTAEASLQVGAVYNTSPEFYHINALII